MLYEGSSLIDGSPVVALATLGSSNRKTGAMVQTWILRADMTPIEATRAGADGAICGDCPHRWSLGGGCYVNIGQAPLSVYRAWDRGAYAGRDRAEDVVAALQTGVPLRLGAYGDPMAVPADVWRDLLDMQRPFGQRATHTGYTHRWRDARDDADDYRDFLMASVDNAAEAELAAARGWRYFRVLASGAPEAMHGELQCVNESHGVSCADCGLCNGARSGARSIFIDPHGALVSRVRRIAALRVIP